MKLLNNSDRLIHNNFDDMTLYAVGKRSIFIEYIDWNGPNIDDHHISANTTEISLLEEGKFYCSIDKITSTDNQCCRHI